jgi:hypothetical protein
LYPATPILSVEASQDKSMVFSVALLAIKLAGVLGASVSLISVGE